MTADKIPQIGLLLPSHETVLWADGDCAFLLEAARLAEQAGYDSVWAGDSLLARPRAEPLTLLAAVAAATARLRLGTAVLLPLLRHPLTLAHTVTSVDRIAQGRLILGLGPGAPGPDTGAELAALGVVGDRPVNALLSRVERCRQLWRGQDTDVNLLPTPYRPGGPPLWLAGQRPRMLRLAGRQFDGWLPVSPTPQDYASGLHVMRQAAEQVGRDPDAVTAGVYLTIAIADTPQQAAEELDAYLRSYYHMPSERVAQMAKGMACHAGTVESAASWVADYAGAGARHVVIRLARPTLDGYHDTARGLLGAARRQ
jgi:alkanesulfonate monooxygenase SsuD/methylene tetrahydromethanopterin reductase-like flavin-dependent oxidoreductase (luciferase family)